MKRRTFLGTVSIGVTTISGCLTRTDSSGDVFATDIADPYINNSSNTSISDTTATESLATETATPENQTKTSQPAGRERVASGKRKETTIGSRSVTPDGQQRPYGVTLSNATDKMWVASLTIRMRPTGSERNTQSGSSTVLDTTYELESHASVDVSLVEPGHYSIEVTIPKRGTTSTTNITYSQFDCNHSSTNITIRPNGSLKIRAVSTQMGCSTDNWSRSPPS